MEDDIIATLLLLRMLTAFSYIFKHFGQAKYNKVHPRHDDNPSMNVVRLGKSVASHVEKFNKKEEW